MKQTTTTVRPRLEIKAEADHNSLYWPILQYYDSQPGEKVLQMIEEAARLFWMPYAYLQDPLTSASKTVDTAYLCLYGLNWRITEIRHQFSLSLPSTPEIMPTIDPKQSKVEFHWSYRPELIKDEPTELLWRSLKSQEMGLTLKHKILTSSLSYWGAYALQFLGITDPQNLAIMADNCVVFLTEHCQFLTNYFKLNREDNLSSYQSQSESSEDYHNLEFSPVVNQQKLESMAGEKPEPDLLNCPELDEVGLQMFGTEQF